MKKRVLVVHPVLEAHGGGQAVAAWTIEALKDAADLSLLTQEPVDHESINRYYGTHLKPGDFHVHYLGRAFQWMPRLLPIRGNLLRTNLLTRSCRRLVARQHFDTVISTSNELDFGARGIQYVHFPWAYRKGPSKGPSNDWSVKAYGAICRRIGGSSVNRIRKNLTLANSEFVRGIVRETHGIDSLVVPPPVPGGFPDIAWEQRETAFVGLGRLAPEKSWEQAVEILGRVRAAGWDVRFTLIGSPDKPETERELRRLEARRSGWFAIRANVPRDEMVRMIARHRFGIHAMEREHFGIGIAEIQRAGCVPFVHRSGGPMEIAGFDERLMFETPEEATAKIVRVLGDAAQQRELASEAKERGNRYTSENFMTEMQRIVQAEASR